MKNGQKQIYLDNACTTFPKPQSVAENMYKYLTEMGSNINRGSYNRAYNTEEMVYETRELLCRLFNGPDIRNVVFTRGITESLNIVIKGFFHEGDHVIVSPYEHNAVMRPLNALRDSHGKESYAEKGLINYDRIPLKADGSLDISAIKGLIRKNTRAVIVTHASNVSGMIMPIEKIGSICREKGIKLIVDSAQTAGSVDIDMKRMGIDVLTFTGHKGLMGPQGIGGLIMTDEMAGEIMPFIEGGTGSISDKEVTPEFMPDKFEAGTLNIPGIAGLNAALKWIDDVGIEAIHKKECELSRLFDEGIRDLENEGKIRILRNDHNQMPEEVPEYVGIVSIDCLTMDNSSLAALLDEKYGIQTRVGLHCSPAAHRSIGTFPGGAVRFSFGYFNDSDDVKETVAAIHEIV